MTRAGPNGARTGRPINRPRLSLTITAAGFAVAEDGRPLVLAPTPLPFTRSFLYLQVSSHSNYAAREIYFQDLAIGEA